MTTAGPDGVQRQASGEVLAHLDSIRFVLGDPTNLADSDLGDMFTTDAYFDLLDPDGVRDSAREVGDSMGTIEEGCVQISGHDVAFDCNVRLSAVDCNVFGGGSGDTDAGFFEGTATLSGPAAPCGDAVTVDTAFALDSSTASGRLSIDSEGAAPFGFDVEMQELQLCENGLPLTGVLIVDGRGGAEGLPFDPLVLEFTGEACGFGVLGSL